MVKNFLLLAFSLLLAGLGSELFARHFFPEWAPRTGTITQFWQFDSRYGWSHVPGASGRFTSFGFDTAVTTNSAGFRGREVPLRKQPSKARILVLGDSYVWGFGVQEDEIFTNRIERLCPAVETVNFGVSGYSTDQELLLLRDKGIAYGPDIVVLVLAGNDYEDNTRSTVYVYYNKPTFKLDGDRLILTNQPVPQMNVLLRTFARLAQQSYVLTQINRSIEAIVRAYRDRPASGKARDDSGAAPAPPRAYPRTQGQAITVRLVKEIAASVRAAGSRLVVVLTEDQGKGARELEKAVADPGVSYVFLDDILGREKYESVHLPGDFHWNAVGHALVAQAVSRSLVETKKLAPDACPVAVQAKAP